AIVGIPVGLVVWGNIYSNYSDGVIVIRSNNDFTLRYNFPGEGTFENPFRIENLVISSSKEFGIFITDVSKNFIIINCTITGVSQGIYLEDIVSSYTQIENNTIFLDGVTSSYGIHSNYNIDNISIINNKIQGNNNRQSSYGIYLIHSNNQIINKNNISSFNRGIFCNNLENINITQNNIFSNTIGIAISHSTSLLVLYNNLMFNLQYGILSDYNTGVFHHNNFFNNLLIPESGQSSQAHDRNGYSRWYDISTKHGNYWSDLIWTEEAVYPLDGEYYEEDTIYDLFPLKYPV
ncbi:MAG: hypothetical protein FK734_12440, partial [Asgard group archaeon]|nr:hypothetical protein [Asgard group archaeon]